MISTREANGREDSDFYALVWEPGDNAPKQICYASTRGWTYPNHASADATPELVAKYQAHLAAIADERKAADQRALARTPTVGKRIKVVKGRKVPIGTEGEVFWYGQQREYGPFPRGGYKAHGREMHALAVSLVGRAAFEPNGFKEGMRIGFKTEGGEKFFTAATNVEVVLEEVRV